jgi:competence ComEA-like helix-hairpin-helix protein
VDVNTASVSLLSHVAGVNSTVAKNIVAYREENGPFRSRAALKKVPRLGPKAFEQCAGFLRVPDGKDPIENTGVHPESYEAAKALLNRFSLTPAKAASGALTACVEETGYPELAKELDSKITTILRGSRVSVTQAAILVALQYADDAGKNSGNADNLRAQLKSYLEDAAQAKSERDFYKRELERIKAVATVEENNTGRLW